jgi:hypothetical protein
MDCLKAALEYAEQGYYVFPVHRFGEKAKRPATQHGHLDATRDADQIRKWFATSAYGVAIAVGASNVTVWDLDPGSDEFLADNPAVLDDLLRGFIAQTPRGGNHYWFRNRSPATAPSAIAQSVDIKSDGGYVIVAPTTLENGSYEWIEDDLPAVNDLPDMPTQLKKLVTAAAGKRKEMPRLQDGIKLTEGNRNAGLYLAGIDLIRAGVQPSELEAILHVINHSRCDPALPDHEVRGRVQSALKSQAASVAKVDISGLMHERFVRMSTVEPKPVPWLWPGRFAIGACHLLVGMPGCGKSTFLCWLCSRITAGGSLPDDQEIQHHGSVLYLTSEDPLDYSLAPRLDAAGADRSKVFAVRSLMSLPADIPQIERLVQDEPIKAILIDPVTSFLAGDHNDNQAVRSGLDELGSFAKEHGMTVIMVSHNSKAERKGMYSALGAVAFSAFVRGVHTFQREKDNWVIEDAKNSLAPTAPKLYYDLSENRLNWLHVEEATPIKSVSLKPPSYADMMAECLKEGRKTKMELRQALKDILGYDIGSSGFRAAKHRLKSEYQIAEDGDYLILNEEQNDGE